MFNQYCMYCLLATIFSSQWLTGTAVQVTDARLSGRARVATGAQALLGALTAGYAARGPVAPLLLVLWWV